MLLFKNGASAPAVTSAPPLPTGEGIPALLHQVWLGAAPLPARWSDFSDHLQAMNPEFEYRRWGDVDADALLAGTPYEQLYKGWANPGFRSDILRLLILQQFGGIYLDTDCEPVRPLSNLRSGREAFVGATFQPQPIAEVLVENAVIGSCPAHPFIQAALSAVLAACQAVTPDEFARGAPNVVLLSGPGQMSRVLTEYRQKPESLAFDVSVLPSRAFYPVVPGGEWQYAVRPAATREEFPDTYLVHWWDGSWVRLQEDQKKSARDGDAKKQPAPKRAKKEKATI